MADLLGKRIAQYRIDSLLGEGGMGLVYRAYDETLKSPVALKIMHTHLASKPDFRDRFLQEAQVVASLRDHASIVTVYESDYQAGQLYLVMEFIPDGSLNDYLQVAVGQRSIIQLSETLHLLAQVAEALHYAHRKGVVHRDIKPSNILIRKLEEPERPEEPALRAVVADFGLAKLRAGGKSHTQTGAFLGTLQYMSPEQCRAEALDGRSDIYSLGIVLYQMATGRLPFAIGNPYEAGVKHISEQPPDPRAIQPVLPALVRDIILKAIAKDPAARFQNAMAMARALRSTIGSLKDRTQHETGVPTISIATTGLPAHDALATISPVSNPPAGDYIEIATWGQKTYAFPLSKATTTIGSREDNDVVLNDPMVSRHHARIDFDEAAGYSIIDLGSTNGTYFEETLLTPNIAQPWAPGQTVRVGRTRLSLQSAAQRSLQGPRTSRLSGPVSGSLGPVGNRPPSTGYGDRPASLVPKAPVVDPGNAVTLTVTVRNDGPIVEHFRVSVDGLPMAWVTLPPVLPLMSGDQQSVPVVILPPRVPQSRAGQYAFTVRVISTRDATQSVELRGTLTVNAYSGFLSDMHPQRLRPRQEAHVTLENQGNVEENFTLAWRDQANEVTFTPPQARLTVPPGEKAAATFHAKPQRRPLLGGETPLPFNVDITSSKGTAQTHGGMVINKAWLPIWILAVLAMLCILLSIAGVFIYNQITIGRERELSATATAEAARQGATATATWLEQDDDGDGLINREEIKWGSNPQVEDSDGDTISDGDEVSGWTRDGETYFYTSPVNPNTDGEGLPDNTDPDPGNVPTPTPVPSETPLPTATLTPTDTPTPLAPSIEFFRVDPDEITAGSCANLEWGTVTDATAVTIDQGIGSVAATPGSRQVCPSETTTYIITATGPGGVTTASVTCIVPQFAAMSVIATVEPSSFSGACPKKFDFSASITVNGPGTVTYKWERSDGAQAPVETITFAAAGSQTIASSWTLSAEGTRWQQVHILTPNDMLSSQASFTLACWGPETVDQMQTGMDYGYWFEDDVIRWQEFMPTLDNITAVEVGVSKAGHPSGNAIVQIRTEAGDLLGQGMGSEPTIPASGWVKISFATPIPITPGTRYRIYVYSDGDSPSADNRYFWRGNTNSTYCPSCQTDVTDSRPTYDYAFKTYGFQ
ncbi:MAG: protein kinase [Anaerolineae bacterium]|nr:protein kinase [Anaerolineae bacterium]